MICVAWRVFENGKWQSGDLTSEYIYDDKSLAEDDARELAAAFVKEEERGRFQFVVCPLDKDSDGVVADFSNPIFLIEMEIKT